MLATQIPLATQATKTRDSTQPRHVTSQQHKYHQQPSQQRQETALNRGPWYSSNTNTIINLANKDKRQHSTETHDKLATETPSTTQATKTKDSTQSRHIATQLHRYYQQPSQQQRHEIAFNRDTWNSRSTNTISNLAIKDRRQHSTEAHGTPATQAPLASQPTKTRISTRSRRMARYFAR